MRIGIVAICKGKRRSLKDRIFGSEIKTVCLPESKNPFETVVAELPPPSRGRRGLERFRMQCGIARELLKAQGASAVLYDNGVLRYCPDMDGRWPELKKEYFLRLAADNIERIAGRCSVELMKAVACIEFKGMDRLSRYIVRELSYKVRDIRLCTEKSPELDGECGEIADELGFYPTVVKTCTGCDVVISTDEGYVRIGRDVKLTDVELDIETYGFCIETSRIAAVLGEKVSRNIKMSFIYGKNKLTL